MGEFFGKDRKIRRVGLISPCSGNLGNAAILSSMIANIRLRIPDAEIIGITLSPDDTRLRHGIAGFPITGRSNGSYILADPPAHAGWQNSAGRPPLSLKERLKQIGWLRRFVRIARTTRQELAHIFRAGRLVRTMDRVAVAGGGALDDYWGGPWGHPWTLFKFAVLSRVFRVPFLFVSVGMCTLDHRLSRWFVGGALRLSQYRSYRDHKSQADMGAMFPGLSSTVQPDLAYGYGCPELPLVRKDTSRGTQLRIALNPIAFLDPRVWPVKDVHRYSRYIDELAMFLKRVISDGHRLILFGTDGTDTETVNDLLRLLTMESSNDGHIEVLPGPPQQTTEKLLRDIDCADLVVASRLHAVMLSHLIGLPVVAISFDRKVDVHMSDIGQAEYCMNIDEFTADTLLARVALLADSRELESSRIRRAVQLNREQAGAQYDLLFGAVPSDTLPDHSSAWLVTQVQR